MTSKRNPYAAVQVDPDSDYITPGTLDLEQLFWTGTTAPYIHVNQVWPRIYIGDEWVNSDSFVCMDALILLIV